MSWDVPLLQYCRQHNINPTNFKQINQFKVLFDAIVSIFPPILLPHSHNKSLINRFWYTKHLAVYHFRHSIIQSLDAKGFYVCSGEKSYPCVKQIVFSCSSGGFVSNTQLCDGSVDCPEDNSD